MKIKDGFNLRTIMGKSIIVAEGAQLVDFDKIVSLNDSAALLWKSVEGKDFTVDDMADALVDNYGIDRDVALSDAGEIAEQWIKVGLVDR